MSKYFKKEELIDSATALARGIDNTPPPAILPKLAALASKLLDPVREIWGGPIHVNSGYRSPVLNKAINGAANSQHIRGEAADITTGSVAGNRKLFNMLVDAQNGGRIVFDQLIDESNYAWLHVSYKAAGNRGEILHLK